MKYISAICKKNNCYKTGKPLIPKGIMIHSIGTPQPDAKVIANAWNTPTPFGKSVLPHAVLDRCTCYQTLPFDMCGWHGGGTSNSTHLGIEMTEPDTIRYESGANFTDSNPGATEKFVRETYKNAVGLFADLCFQFGLNPLSDGVIVSHSEGHNRGIASNHADVEHLWSRFGLTMDGFRKDVLKAMNNQQEITEIDEIVAKLKKIGIITNSDLWLEKLKTDLNSYWLARKVANIL